MQIISRIILCLTFCGGIDTYGFNFRFEDGVKVFKNGLTYIILQSDSGIVKIFDMDLDSHHPVLPKHLWRGDFNLVNLQNSFYSIINKELPGERCIQNTEVTYIPHVSEFVTVRFNLGNSKDHYVIMAESLQTKSIYSFFYPMEKEINLPVDKSGYRFSIKPAECNKSFIGGIINGFSPTLKYLNLREVKNEFFSSGGIVEISLPFFCDEIFDLWCISGEIIQINNQILNEKIIWHGMEFLLYERIKIFKF